MNILSVLESLKQNFPAFKWTFPPDLNHGILATNEAFIQAKESGRNPAEVATEISDELKNFIHAQDLPLKVATVGPYVNLDLDAEKINWASNVAKIELPKASQKLLLEYISPNVAKPLHVGHIRNANLGETLRRILSLKYPDMVTDNHWGDWGVQFGILLWAWKRFQARGSLETLINDRKTTVTMDDYARDPVGTLVKVYVWGNSRKEDEENWEQIVRDEFLRLEKGDEENRAIWQEFVKVSQGSLQTDLELLNVPRFDLEQGESFYEEDMRLLYQFMEDNDIWKSDGRARFLDLNRLPDNWPQIDPDLATRIDNFGRCYLVSSNGYTTYAFRDVAARWQWARDIEADLMITITGNEQTHNFNQAFSIISYLASLPEFAKFNAEFLAQNGRNHGDTSKIMDRLQWKNLLNLNYGFLSLPEGKMSTRKGKILAARELIRQIIDHVKQVIFQKGQLRPDSPGFESTARKVAVAALKWYDLQRDSASDIVLDIPKILSFEGNTGVYQLYTLVRLRSILQNNGASSDDPNDFNPTLLNPDELLILKKVYLLPQILQNICENFKPHHLCNYLFELDTKINGWYVKYSVSNEPDEDRKKTLLAFCELLEKHLDFALDLLAIETVKEV